jgi:TatD DNase family protein
MIDVHCHLTSDEFSVDLDAVLSRSVESGVTHMIAVSMDAQDARDAQALSLRFPFLYYGVGFHPEKVDEKVDESSFSTASFRDAMESFERSFADQKTDDRCVCIGEVGIDHARKGGVEKEELKKDHQRLAFELACKLSRESRYQVSS